MLLERSESILQELLASQLANFHTQIVTDEAEFLIMATGLLSRWKWPDIPGIETFKGQNVHTANWDNSIDLKQEVGLIGAGSTGIQVLPSIQPIVSRCYHFVQGENWISPLGISGDELILRKSETGNCK